MPGPYTRVSAGNPGNSGATAATTIVNAHSDGIEALEAGVYNVKAYGALGDGVTNDTAAIDAACTALNASTYGGVLYFPAGVYRTTGGHAVNKGAIVGQGQSATIIVGAGTSDQFTIAQQVMVADLRLTSLATWASGTRPASGSGLRVNPGVGVDYWAGDIHIRNAFVYGFYDNLSFTNAQRFVIHGSFIGGAARYNLYLRNPQFADLGDFSISDTHINSNSTDTSVSHIRWESGGGMRVTNCKIMGGAPVGIDMAWATGAVSGDINVSNCSIENFSTAGIRLVTSSGASFARGAFTGNQIAPYDAVCPSILLDGTNGNLSFFAITGNQFASSPITLRNAQGVTIAGNSYSGTLLDADGLSTYRNLDA